MKFEQFDPRPTPEAKAHNDKIIAGAKQLIGIEVTIPSLADQCFINIDPQHTDNDITTCALDIVTSDNFKQNVLPTIYHDATLVTVRPDSDSIASMCILDLHKNTYLGEFFISYEKIKEISDHDKFVKNPVFSKTPLDLKSPITEFEVVNSLMLDFNVSLGLKVILMKDFLRGYMHPAHDSETSEIFLKKASEMIKSKTVLENQIFENKIRFDVSHHENLVVLETTHHNVAQLAYSKAPVAVCVNPECTLMSDKPYLKYTIFAYNENYANIKAALNELNSLEKGWGGSPVIGGSPQGSSSKLDLQTVITVVKKYIKY